MSVSISQLANRLILEFAREDWKAIEWSFGRTFLAYRQSYTINYLETPKFQVCLLCNSWSAPSKCLASLFLCTLALFGRSFISNTSFCVYLVCSLFDSDHFSIRILVFSNTLIHEVNGYGFALSLSNFRFKKWITKLVLPLWYFGNWTLLLKYRLFNVICTNST